MNIGSPHGLKKEREKLMGINNLNRGNDFDRTEKAVLGLGCLFVIMYVAWIGLLIWAIIKIVTHFT